MYHSVRCNSFYNYFTDNTPRLQARAPQGTSSDRTGRSSVNVTACGQIHGESKKISLLVRCLIAPARRICFPHVENEEGRGRRPVHREPLLKIGQAARLMCLLVAVGPPVPGLSSLYYFCTVDMTQTDVSQCVSHVTLLALCSSFEGRLS